MSSRLYAFPAISPAGIVHTGCSRLPISQILEIGSHFLHHKSHKTTVKERDYMLQMITI